MLFSFLSCKKDIFTKQNTETNSYSTPVIDRSNSCLNIPILCEGKLVKTDKVLALVGNGGGGFWEVYPAEIIKNEPAIILKSPTGESFFLTKTTNSFLASRETPTPVPSALKAILDLPLSTLKGEEIQGSDFQSIYGNQINATTFNGKDAYLINSNFNPTPNPNWKAYSLCEGSYLATLANYMEQLDIPFSSTLTYEAVVDEALLSCAGINNNDVNKLNKLNAYYCYKGNCNSVCVVENILAHPVVSGSTYLPQQVKLNYMKLLIKIPEDIYTNLQATSEHEVVAATYQHYMTSPNICDQLQDFDNLDDQTTPVTETQLVPQVGVKIMSPPQGDIICNGAFVGDTDDRHPLDEDLNFGANATGAGIVPFHMVNHSNQTLFNIMGDLFNLTTVGSSSDAIPLKPVADEFINLFNTNTSNAYEHHNINLNNYVASTTVMKNFIARFVSEYRAKFIANNNSTAGIFVPMGTRHPVFGSEFRYKGLQILINDTEQTEMYMQNFTTIAPNIWEADFCFKITDNFGLDDPDAQTYGWKHRGFTSWWMLQHQRNFRPFITKIYINARVRWWTGV